MIYNLSITKQAEEDLNSIIMYMLYNLSNKVAAENFVTQVSNVYDRIKKNPHIYSECSNKVLKNKHYRRVVIGNYVMVYRCDEDTVYILRFFYGGQDYIKLI